MFLPGSEAGDVLQAGAPLLKNVQAASRASLLQGVNYAAPLVSCLLSFCTLLGRCPAARPLIVGCRIPWLWLQVASQTPQWQLHRRCPRRR